MSLIPRSVENRFSTLLDGLIPFIGQSGICPNSISTLGCFSNIFAALLLVIGQFAAAGVFILLGGLLDVVDGKFARLTMQVSSYGAVYDATMDRIGELAIYTGIGGYFVLHHMYRTTMVVVVAAGGSLLISYVRARAESYNISCDVGMLRRGERIVLFGLGSALNFLSTAFHQSLSSMIVALHVPQKFVPMPVTVALLGIAILAPVTVAQRLMYIRHHVQLNPLGKN